MRYSFLIALLACTSMSLKAQITETAPDAVKNMGLGWNLGNTLDANNGSGTDITAASYWGKQDINSETCWGQPITTSALFKMMKEAGFGAIRVPVTWYNHMDKNGKVDAAWMKRVHEVVDYVIDNDLYCILNVHHDTGAGSSSFTHWVQADDANYKANKEKFEGLWTQIAEEFKSYDKKLLFEGYNEMLDKQSAWNAPKNSSSYKALNNYAQSFVNAVRATGGNNETRNLVVCTYAAANGEDAVKNLALPQDKAKDHTIVEVHAYPNFFTWSNNPTLRTISQVKGDVDYIINNLKKYYINKGIPAIIGEWGSYGVDNGAGKTDYDVRKDMFFEFCEYFLKQAKNNNVAMFYWMGLSDGMNRSVPAFNQADLAELFAKTFHGSSFVGKYPVLDKMTSHTAFEGEKKIGWGNGINISSDIFKNIEGNVKIELGFSFGASGEDDIQLFDGNWKSKPSFVIDGVTYNGDYSPRFSFESNTLEHHTVTLFFDDATNAELKKSGLIIHGNDVTLYKVTIIADNGSGLDVIEQTDDCGAIYNLSGQKVSKMTNGIYIKQGNKIIVK